MTCERAAGYDCEQRRGLSTDKSRLTKQSSVLQFWGEKLVGCWIALPIRSLQNADEAAGGADSQHLASRKKVVAVQVRWVYL